MTSSRQVIFASVCSLMGSIGPVHAGPDEVTNNLMNRGISLFDFGMYRLGGDLDALAASDGGYTITYPDYSIDNNVIMIRGLRLVEPGEDKESICAEWIRSIREAGHVDTEAGGLTEEAKQYLGMSRFAKFFTYPSITRLVDGKTDLEVAKELDKKIFLEIVVTENTPPPETPKELVCTAPLLGRSFAQEYREWEN